MAKSIELDQVLDPICPGRTISDVHQDGVKITVEFLDKEGADIYPLEDLTASQLRALVLALVNTYPEE